MSRYLNIFLFEFKHFVKSKTKVISYLFFVLACVFSLINGFDLEEKQLNTIDNIKLSSNLSLIIFLIVYSATLKSFFILNLIFLIPFFFFFNR